MLQKRRSRLGTHLTEMEIKGHDHEFHFRSRIPMFMPCVLLPLGKEFLGGRNAALHCRHWIQIRNPTPHGAAIPVRADKPHLEIDS